MNLTRTNTVKLLSEVRIKQKMVRQIIDEVLYIGPSELSLITSAVHHTMSAVPGPLYQVIAMMVNGFNNLATLVRISLNCR